MKKSLIICALTLLPLLAIAQSEDTSPRPEGGKQAPPGMAHRRGGNAGFARGEWLKRLESENPEEFQRLQTLRENDPEAFRKEMRAQMEKRVVGFVKQHSGGLENETRELGKKYRTADTDKEKAAIKAELETKVHQAFDARLEGQKKLIAHLEEKLDELKKQVQTREKNREAICRKRVTELTENPNLRW